MRRVLSCRENEAASILGIELQALTAIERGTAGSPHFDEETLLRALSTFQTLLAKFEANGTELPIVRSLAVADALRDGSYARRHAAGEL